MSLYEEEDAALLPDAAAAAAWALRQPMPTPAKLIAPPPPTTTRSTTPATPMTTAALKPSPRPPRPASRPTLTPVLGLRAKNPPNISTNLRSNSPNNVAFNTGNFANVGQSSGGFASNIGTSSVNLTKSGGIGSLGNSSGKQAMRDDRGLLPLHDLNWQPTNEYDPAWPNDYRTVVKEMRGAREAEDQAEESESRKRRYAEASKERSRERFHATGFSRIRQSDDEDEDNEDEKDHNKSSRSSSRKTQGAAIAPPPSLTETSNPSPPVATSSGGSAAGGSHGLNVAAKIMAKFGYKHGQGLGKMEQGMSQALSVEKTSKRGGRILHEKELLPPPMPPPFNEGSTNETNDSTNDDSETSDGKPSICDLMKNPSKVVLCMNMVGPGEVDHELEPEVADECSSKYGDVAKVLIYETKAPATPEEAVRIFIEFKRVESAIKALVGLNGRFFGGREVQARFYDPDKFKDLKLTE